jgi:hypothetical protein
MAREYRANTKRIRNAIPGSKGIITEIAKKCGYCWSVTKKAIDNNPKLLQAWNDEREKILDETEIDLMTNMKVDPVDRRFYLQTQGKHRGYGEKVEVNGGEPLTIKIVYDNRNDSNTPE